MRDASHSAEGIQEASLTAAGTRTRYGAPQEMRSWVSTAAGAGPCCGNTNSSIPPTYPYPVLAHEGALDLQHYCQIGREFLATPFAAHPCHVTRSSQCTTQTYLSTASVYSGIHSGDSHTLNPSSLFLTRATRDTNPEWYWEVV